MEEKRVLFVCTGNTCRSPMAEGLFRIAAEGKNYQVSSAGVAAMDGCAASSDTVAIVESKGGELSGFESRMVDAAMLEEATKVFCMTRSHLETLEHLFPEFEEKYFLATEFVEIDGQVGKDISDPIGGGRAVYEATAKEIEAAIGGILGFLEVKD